MSLWHYAIGEDVHGPIPLDDLRTLIRTRGTSEDVFVWRGGMPDWLPASDVPELIRQVQGTESASTNISAASTPRTQTAAAPPSGLPVSSKGWRSTTPSFSPPTSRNNVYPGGASRMRMRKGGWSGSRYKPGIPTEAVG